MKRPKIVAKVKAAFRRNTKPEKVNETSRVDDQGQGMCPGVVDNSTASALDTPKVEVTKAKDNITTSPTNNNNVEPPLSKKNRLLHRVSRQMSTIDSSIFRTRSKHARSGSKPAKDTTPVKPLTTFDFTTEKEKQDRRTADEQHRINKQKKYAASQAALRHAQAAQPRRARRLSIRNIIRHHPWQNVSSTVIYEEDDETQHEAQVSLVSMLEAGPRGVGSGAAGGSSTATGRPSTACGRPFTARDAIASPVASAIPAGVPAVIHPTGIYMGHIGILTVSAQGSSSADLIGQTQGPASPSTSRGPKRVSI